jgi:hypothetical protein
MKALAVHRMLGWRAKGCEGSLLSRKANVNRGTLSCFFSSSRRFQDPWPCSACWVWALVQGGCAHPVVVEPSVSVHSRIGHVPVYSHVGVPGSVYYARRPV